MSQQRINLSPDLTRLRTEGYNLSIVGAHIVVKDVSYLNAIGEIRYGAIASTFNDGTVLSQQDHTVIFVGEYPCDQGGQELSRLINQKSQYVISDELVAGCMFSQKRKVREAMEPYPDFYLKFTTYINIVSAYALARGAIDPRTFAPQLTDDPDSPFEFVDTASSKANILPITRKLENQKLAIVGLGGTGSYVLDYLAKTPALSIALFDGDRFLSHNAFRTPGAASFEDLDLREHKVAYFARKYACMKRNIIPHPVYINETNIEELRAMDYVFLCMDDPEAKGLLFAKLKEFGVSFVDVGMGIYQVDGKLQGTLRVTASTPDMRDHVVGRVNMASRTDDDYSHNIQIVELNALSAALAVIRWKKEIGFYGDTEGEHHTTYMINGNSLANEFKRWPEDPN